MHCSIQFIILIILKSFFHRQSNPEEADQSKAKQVKHDGKNKHEDKTLDNNKKTDLCESKCQVVPTPTPLQGLIAYSDSNDESEED